MTSITPFLWFDNNVPEAVAFYKSVFPNAKIETVEHNVHEDRQAHEPGEDQGEQGRPVEGHVTPPLAPVVTKAG